MIKTLSETSVFKYANSMDSTIIQQMKTISELKEGTILVTEEQLADVLFKMRHKSFKFTAKFAVIDLLRSGVIRLVYTENVRLTVAIPFFNIKLKSGGFGVIVNISNYAKMDTDGSVSIDPVVLYSLMLTAAYSLVAKSNISDSSNYKLPELYGALFANVISRTNNLDQIKRSKVLFICTKFFYMQLGIDDTRATDRASNSVKYIDKHLLEQIELVMPVDSYGNLSSFIESTKNAFPEFTNFNLASIFDKWMRSYGEAAAFGIEYIPYFHMIFVALITNCNNIINVKSIEREAARNDTTFIKLFARMESSVIDLSKR